MTGWWRARNARERVLLGFGAGGVLLAVLYGAWWAPLEGEVAALRVTVATQRADLAWMRRAGEELARTPAVPAAVERPPLLARVDQGARAAGLADALRRIEPLDGGRLALGFDAADFDALVAWLEELLVAGGVRLEAATIERVAAPGRVDARLVLTPVDG